MNRASNIKKQRRNKNNSPSEVIAELQKLYSQGMSRQAVLLTKKHAKQFEKNPKVIVALAALCLSYDQKSYARRLLEQVLRSDPDNVRGLYNYGLLELKNGNLSVAKDFFSSALLIDPNYTSALQNLLYILVNAADVKGVRKWFKKLSELNTDSQENLLLFVKAFKSLNLDAEFSDAAVQLIKLNPYSFESNFNFALSMQRVGKLEVAKKYYKEALILQPKNLDACNNLAKIFFDEGDIQGAIKLLDKADLTKASKPTILYNMGVALYAVGEVERAEKYLRTAIKLDDTNGDPHYTLGLISKDKNAYDDAHFHFGKAIKHCDPNTSMHTDSVAQKWLLARYHLDWKISQAEEENIKNLGISTAHISPFTALPMEDNPRNQLLRAQKFSTETYPVTQIKKDFAHYRNANIINIAYISADFRQFPGMTLMSGMFAAHDREKFKIYALSYGPDSNDLMRQKIMRDVDKFIDVKEFTDDEIVALCSNLNIHVAIHRNGYTKLHRTGIFAKRAAPIQINYLGFPSTMGADFIDYMVADQNVIPADARENYSEKIIYMPNCYQPNDRNREIPSSSHDRLYHGLPKHSLVLCCFNNSYKISADEFSIWCDILRNYDDVVLWLLDPGERGRENLRKFAKSRGVAETKLIFAPKVNHTEHLARHVHADIFVDTFIINAHTTATDALLMGLPVVTMEGRQFSARVAGSVLRSAGLSELVATSREAYKNLICDLIDNQTRLDGLKSHCRSLKDHSGLFDTDQYTKNFEKGLISMFNLFKSGCSPRDVIIGKAND